MIVLTHSTKLNPADENKKNERMPAAVSPCGCLSLWFCVGTVSPLRLSVFAVCCVRCNDAANNKNGAIASCPCHLAAVCLSYVCAVMTLCQLAETFRNGSLPNNATLTVASFMLDAYWMFNERPNGNCKVSEWFFQSFGDDCLVHCSWTRTNALLPATTTVPR
jgi:hypothetical protein